MHARPPSDSQQQMRSCSRSRSLSQPTWRARKMHGDAGEATPRAEATGGGSGSAGGSGWESAATVAVGWVLMEEETAAVVTEAEGMVAEGRRWGARRRTRRRREERRVRGRGTACGKQTNVRAR